MAASLLTGVVVFMRKRSQRSSETEAENGKAPFEFEISIITLYSSVEEDACIWSC